MKIIVFENNYLQGNKTEDLALSNAIANNVVYTLPDTALLKDHRPFFIPDFADPCTMQLHLVVRICRLGRSISARFAHRYYDAVSVGVTFTAENILQELKKKGLPWELAKGFDGAAALGTFLPLENVPNGMNTDFSLRLGEEEAIRGYGKNMTKPVEELVAEISEFYTLKQGDFLFLGCPMAPVPSEADTHVTGYIGEEKVLSFNIK